MMSPLSHDLYEGWRGRGRANSLADAARASSPSERLLQQVWQHQRLLRDKLETLDGRKARILHPGFWNHEAGPDFRDSIVQIGNEAIQTGDIEIDLVPQGWRQHGHEGNTNYQRVILQVVWEAKGTASHGLPILSLQKYLDAPLEELEHWLGRDSLVEWPHGLSGQCSAPLKDLSPSVLTEVVHQAARVRLQRKAAQLQARARQAGWNQTLWEGLLGALGYKNNNWPMRRLAELVPWPESIPGKRLPTAALWQGRLLGVGNLLPSEMTGEMKQVDGYVRTMWDYWWRERDSYTETLLPKKIWRFNGLRPANHPQRRLALAGHWLADGDLPQNLEKWANLAVPDAKLSSSLLDILQAQDDPFWSLHWTFRSRPMGEPKPLLGTQRANDLAVNIVLPWLWVRAIAGGNHEIRKTIDHRYFHWPPSEDNALLRLARKRLLGGARNKELRTAAGQQGLLQIVRDFCDYSNAVCENCPFPELVRAIGN